MYLRPENASGSSWSRNVRSRGGDSERTVRRDVATVKKTIDRVGSSRKPVSRGAILEAFGPPLFKYSRHKRQVLSLDRDASLSLQEAGGMTDRQMLAFGRQFANLTRIRFHDKANSLAALTSGLVPDFTVSMVKVNVKGQEVERQCFLVDRLVDVVNGRIRNLYESRLLKLSSTITHPLG